MRIVTRPDFDGIVCAVLLRAAENIHSDIYWVEPGEIQAGKASISTGDILANLPYAPGCSLWFDHHISNVPDHPVPGAFKIAPSAAGVIYRYYQDRRKLGTQFDDLVKNTDIIDAADLTREQVRHPEKYPYILLSMTVKNDGYKDMGYWNRLVMMLMTQSIDEILDDTDVRHRCDQVIRENDAYEAHLTRHTRIRHRISITDFRSLDRVPHGNRFLSYCLFPDSIASVKIRYSDPEKKFIQISVGKSIFNRQCRTNIGRLLAQFGGGGHDGAGGCTLDAAVADKTINLILNTLFENRKET